jgi:hypothetical protein
MEPCRSRENRMRNQVIEMKHMNPSSNARNFIINDGYLQ